MIPESQKLLRCELESLRCQLQAQTKVSHLSPAPSSCFPRPAPHSTSALTPRPGLFLQAFEFLNHSVTVLKDRCLQQIKIQQLEGENWPKVKVRLEAAPLRVS